MKVDVGLVGFVTVPPVPLTIDQLPVPTTGLFPARDIEVVLQVVAQSVNPRSGPALEIVGRGFTVTETVKGVPGHPFAVGVMV